MAAEIRRRFPGVQAWFGKATGHWWAVTRDQAGRDRLIEASSPAELGRRLEAFSVRTATAPARATNHLFID